MNSSKELTPIKSHDAVMVCVELDQLIQDNHKISEREKRMGNHLPSRYHHGYEEGLERALKIVKKHFGV